MKNPGHAPDLCRLVALVVLGACSTSEPRPSADLPSTDTAPAALAPTCPVSKERCPRLFTYADHGEASVRVMGDYSASGWAVGTPMTKSGGVWQASVPVPIGRAVAYKFMVDGGTWLDDPANPTTDAGGNSVAAALSCASPICLEPAPPPAGVFDWRDAVIYFVFVDRFKDGNPANNCQVPGAEDTATSSTGYLGGDWVGVTQAIDAGYFGALGVNTLWITVPIQNADDVTGAGVRIDGNGAAGSDGHAYTAYHGYWPRDPLSTESCFGTPGELLALVAAAHDKGLKVLFDYAMVHVHTDSAVYKAHAADSPAWFTPSCICGAAGCGNFDTQCWFTSYLAHYDFQNPATRAFSIGAAVDLIKKNGNDAFRLDAIKQVDPSWLLALRPAIASEILAKQGPAQRFYMVGETYDFQNRALIHGMIDDKSGLDGQFDFPLRIRLIEALLMRSTENLLTPDDLGWGRSAAPGMAGLAAFMDSNDDFYPPQAVMSTFIGNHDLPRSIHYAQDTPLWSNAADNGKANAWLDEPALASEPFAYERLANAFAVLMTNQGAPLIYYGDELGLPGAGDPDNRRMMQWSGYSADQQALLVRMQALGQIRSAHPALRRGERKTLFVDADLWVYARTTASGVPAPDTVYVAINRSDDARTTTALPAGLSELLAGGHSNGSDLIPARQTRIFSQTP